MEGRPNRFLIVFKARNETGMELRAEAHYISKEHIARRIKHLSANKNVDKSSIKWFEYLADSFSWPTTGIMARFVVDMKVTKLQPLRDMLY